MSRERLTAYAIVDDKGNEVKVHVRGDELVESEDQLDALIAKAPEDDRAALKKLVLEEIQKIRDPRSGSGPRSPY
jgi:hypothetical protein